mmetsp:Transcript_5062/g.10994  ORF Transcript_5062/g.10994 Transcript_5062/m.10994 type:complete len:245 (-) Transcript_5062:534-1268(-)
MIIRVRLVELTGGELGVVGHVNALIPELPADLVHTLNASNHECLEEELRSDAHIELHAEVVVVGDKGAGSSTTWDHVHHGGLHLQEAAVVQELAHKLDDLGAREEDVTHLGVADEVQVALAVAGLLILQAKVGGRGHVQAGGQQLELDGEDGELALLGLAGEAHHTHNVTALGLIVHGLEAGQLQVGVPGISHNLDLGTLRLEIVEEQLAARCTLAVDASCKRHLDVGQLLAVCQVLVLGNKLW